MKTLTDQSWRRHALFARKLSEFSYRGYRALFLEVPSTSAHHNDAFRYRLLFFPEGGSEPVYAINLEMDALGDYRATAEDSEGRRSFARFDDAPDADGFAALALEKAAETLTPPSPRSRTPRSYGAGSSVRSRAPRPS